MSPLHNSITIRRSRDVHSNFIHITGPLMIHPFLATFFSIKSLNKVSCTYRFWENTSCVPPAIYVQVSRRGTHAHARARARSTRSFPFSRGSTIWVVPNVCTTPLSAQTVYPLPPPAEGTTSSRERKGASTERPSYAKRSQRPCRAQVTRRTTSIIAIRTVPLKKGNRTMCVRIRHVVKSGSAFWCLQRALSF